MKAKCFTHFQSDGNTYFYYFCQGCRDVHYIPVTGPQKWEFNFNLESPTISPSVKHTWRSPTKEKICHYFVRDGIQDFCGDCTHQSAGLQIPLTEYEFPDWYTNNLPS